MGYPPINLGNYIQLRTSLVGRTRHEHDRG